MFLVINDYDRLHANFGLGKTLNLSCHDDLLSTKVLMAVTASA